VADNVTVDNGSLADYSVSADEVTGQARHVQRVKLAASADGSEAHIPADATNGLLVDLGANNDVTVTGTVTVQDGGGSLTVDGAVGTELTEHDLDTGAGVVNGAGVALLLPASGGPVVGGTATNPVRVDPTGSTTQPVSAASLPLPAGAATAAKQPALGTAGAPAADVISIQGVASGVVVPVSDGGGSLTVDGTVAVSALPAGANNIGDVDVATVPAPLSTTGGGTEAAALRVTVANDSTGVLSVDDNGGSLTVDGTVAISGTVTVDSELTTADLDTGAGTDTRAVVGLILPASGGGVLAPGDTVNGLDVDVTRVQGTVTVADGGGSLTVDGAVSLAAALPAGGNNIGDVDVLSVVPGTGATALGKAEDAAHASGDTGVMALAVRQDTPTALAGTAGDYAPLEVGAAGALHVALVGHDTTARLAANSSGLTTATTAYTSGDVLGGELSFASAARITGGRGVIEGAVLLDKADIVGAVDLFLFRAASTPAADNAANGWADADMENLVGVVSFPYPYDSANNRAATWVGAQPYECAATTLFGVLITRSDHTFFTAVTDLRVTLQVRYE